MRQSAPEVSIMQVPVQVTFKGLPVNDDVERACIRLAEGLERFGPIVSCRVVIDKPHRRHVHGNLYDVRLDVRLPGREIAVSRTPSEHAKSEHSDVALREAFDEARRQVQDAVRARRETG
jgi:hypothetical protein